MATICLVIASIIFYAYYNWSYSLILISSIIINYVFHILLFRLDKSRLLCAISGVVFNLSVLCYFKYYNFFVDNINQIFSTGFMVRNIILPLGISFFTFQQVSFLIDTYKKSTPLYNFWNYALFVSFFPQLIAGPIVLHHEMIPQYENKEKRKVNYSSAYKGIQYFVLGLAKKVLIADTFGRAADWGYANVLELNSLSTAVLILSFSIQIYFDFSGYCDMAIGLGKLFNFDIPMNFCSPYQAHSIKEFWRKWHITLTRFFTSYLYIPLGGNRKGKLRAYINIMIIFTFSGLWHGADWSFVVWGMMHGTAVVLNGVFEKYWVKVPALLKWFGTFLFLSFLWVFFRAAHIRQALSVFKRLLSGGSGLAREMAEVFGGSGLKLMLSQLSFDDKIYDLWANIGTVLWFVAVMTIIAKAKDVQNMVADNKTGTAYVLGLSCLFIISLVSLSDIAQFLYFNF